jgi:hypothetical protein
MLAAEGHVMRMQLSHVKAEGPLVEARTPGERLALFLFLFIFIALPVGLLPGTIASAVSGEAMLDALTNAAFFHFGLAIQGTPGLVVYWIALEVARRRNLDMRKWGIIALPLVPASWSIMPGWSLFSGVRGISTLVFTVVVFGCLISYCRTRRVL